MPQRPASEACRILNTEPHRLSAAARSALAALGQVTDVEADRAYLLEHVADFDVLFIALRNTIDAEILARASRLKCIVTPTTGINHVDVVRARMQGIELLSLQGETQFLQNVTATAELTWALLLTLVRRIATAHADVMAGYWRRDCFKGVELKGKTIGIVGCGRLGRMVAQYARAFHMDVLAFDHNQAAAQGIRSVGMPELLASSDVVSIHLPLTGQTRGFFSAPQFAAIKPGAVLLNTARGEIVDEAALVQALSSGRLAGAALDVLAEETSLDAGWLANSPLLAYARAHDNLLLTPHIGGLTADSVEATNLFMIGKLERHLQARAAAG